MNFYNIDVKLYATLYIKAETAEAAQVMAQGIRGFDLEVPDDQGSELPIVGYQFDDPRLPVLSLSPAMTIEGPVEYVSLVEENVPDAAS